MVKRPIKVHLCGSVGSGYALHSDLATTQQALLQLPGLVQLTGLRHADVVYSVREDAVLHMDKSKDMTSSLSILFHLIEFFFYFINFFFII